jgi:glycosyltransferase involved in cell wall biosynthesis
VRSLIVSDWYPSADDPVVGTFVREKARAIATHNDVVVLHPRPTNRPGRALYSVSDELEDGLRTVRLDYRRLRPAALSIAPRVLGARAVLRRLAASGFRPDLIHAHVFSAGFLAVLLAKGPGIPVIVSENSTAFPRGEVRGWQRAMARYAFGHADLVCPASEDLGRHIATLGVRTPQRTVPNVVDTTLFAPPPQPPARDPDGRVRMLLVALLDPKKGIEHLLRALALVRRDRSADFALDVVGDGPLRGHLVDLARSLDLETQVSFLGLRDKREVAELMRGADFFVLPSLWENLPNVVIEAMATGLPVVATRVGGVPEMLDERTGRLVAPGDDGALAEALKAMLDSFTGYDREHIARVARERYGREAVGRIWDEVYADVLARDEARRPNRARTRDASAR